MCLSLKKPIKENSVEKSARKMSNILAQKEEKEIPAVRDMIWPSQEEAQGENDDEEYDSEEEDDKDEEDNDK